MVVSTCELLFAFLAVAGCTTTSEQLYFIAALTMLRYMLGARLRRSWARLSRQAGPSCTLECCSMSNMLACLDAEMLQSFHKSSCVVPLPCSCKLDIGRISDMHLPLKLTLLLWACVHILSADAYRNLDGREVIMSSAPRFFGVAQGPTTRACPGSTSSRAPRYTFPHPATALYSHPSKIPLSCKLHVPQQLFCFPSGRLHLF